MEYANPDLVRSSVPGWWVNINTGEWMSDADYQAAYPSATTSPSTVIGRYDYYGAGDTMPQGYTYTDPTSGAMTLSAPTGANVVSDEQYLQSLVDGKNSYQQAIAGLEYPTIYKLATGGYLDRFSDYDAAAREQMGNYIAQMQGNLDATNSAGDFFNSLIQGAGIHAGNIAEMYQENPQMLLTAGAAGPIGSSLEGDLWSGLGMGPQEDASDIYGRPSEQTYQEQAAQGIDTNATSWMNNLGAAIGAAAAGAGIANALGAGAAPTYEATPAVEAPAAATPYMTDAELQAVLQGTNPPPSISQGVNVAGEPGAVQMPTSPISGYQPPAWAGEQVAAAPGSAEALAQPTYTPNLNLTTPTPASLTSPIVNPSLITPTTVGTTAAGAAAATAAANAASGASSAAPAASSGMTSTQNAGMDLGNMNETGNPYANGPQQSAVNQAAQQGGGVPSGGSGGLQNLGSPLSRILDGSATGADWTSFLGTIGGSALGAYGAHEQAGALRDIAGQENARIREMMAWGQPSRNRFEASMQPGFDISTIPGLQQSMDVTGQTLLRQLSTQGNPYGNPAGLAEVQKYLLGNVALPAVHGYQGLNAGAGGLVQYAAGAAQGPSLAPSMGAAQANQGIYGALGYGLGQATRPNYGYSGWRLV